MRYFLDTEFYEDGRTIDLISIGIVAQDGRELYLCNDQARLDRASPWVRKHVLPHLPTYGHPQWMNPAGIREAVDRFTVEGVGTPVEFWGYYADYDWVALAQLFGTMMDLPKHFPMFCMDLKQLAVMKGDPKLPTQNSGGLHHALEDAHWNKRVYDFLVKLPWPEVA